MGVRVLFDPDAPYVTSPVSCGPKCSVRSGMDTSSRSSRRRWYCTGSTITTASMNAASDARTAGFRSANCC